jgi:hypothetical protein
MLECQQSTLLKPSRVQAGQVPRERVLPNPRRMHFHALDWHDSPFQGHTVDYFYCSRVGDLGWIDDIDIEHGPLSDLEILLPPDPGVWPEFKFRTVRNVMLHVVLGLVQEVASAAGTVASGMITAIQAYTDEAVSQLRSKYEFRDTCVDDFLSTDLRLVAVLKEIADVVPRYFGEEVQLALEVVNDPEDDHDGTLFAVIQTRLSPDEALDRLRAFDQDWWLNRSLEIAGNLTVTLE